MDEVTVVLGDSQQGAFLKQQETLAGVKLRFPTIIPVHEAFAGMVRHQRYDVCEMAIGAFLQARDAGKPLVLLPVVMAGGFHHGSLYAARGSGVSEPRQLKGRRVGVRSFSQTTGLWVRGWLAEEEGVTTRDVTWVVTERSHVEEFQDPPNVVLTDEPISDAVRHGSVDAAIIGPPDAHDLEPLVRDGRQRARTWYQRHGCVPINHMVVATREMLNDHAAVLCAIYQTLTEGIDRIRASAGSAGASAAPPTAIRYGVDNVRSAVALAASYAFEQGLITQPVDDVNALFALDTDDWPATVNRPKAR